jgi:thiamine-monophosphate kinase
LRSLLSGPPAGETWIGDDAAVVSRRDGRLLLAADAVVAGVHVDLSLSGLADVGWKAVAVNVSDIAAMGGEPGHALVTVVVPGGCALEDLYAGIAEAADEYRCPVVGGDLTSGAELVVAVAVTGWVDGAPLLRSGARSGERLFVTGPLGASAAALRELRSGTGEGAAHRRPRARVAEGRAARDAGATAMLDLSDGLVLDLRRLADASGVGVAVDDVPVAAGATEDEALSGGEDYELLFAAPDRARVLDAFAAAGCRPPVEIGRVTEDPGERRWRDGDLPEGGWEHQW